MVGAFQTIYVAIALVSSCGLLYGVQRLRHADASLYWADLILAALFALLITTLFLIVSVAWSVDLPRIAVGVVGLVAVGYRLRQLDPRLRHALQQWYHAAAIDAPLVNHLRAILVHRHG